MISQSAWNSDFPERGAGDEELKSGGALTRGVTEVPKCESIKFLIHCYECYLSDDKCASRFQISPNYLHLHAVYKPYMASYAPMSQIAETTFLI